VDIPPTAQYVTIGDTEVFVARERPGIWAALCAHAELVDEQSDDTRDDAELLVAGIGPADSDWASLILAWEYAPSSRGGFAPGILVVPETGIAFVGAGATLRAYRISPNVEALWKDEADIGFWSWRRHGATVVMSAELELAAWDIDGTKLWSRFVEPPWSYSVHGQGVTLDVMGTETTFDLRTGS
jgi:hypothetical protein